MSLDNIMYKPETTLDEIKELAKEEETVFFAIHTTWWTLRPGDLYTLPGDISLPCDPRKSVLMEGESLKFIEHAEANPRYYGKHGLLAFVASYNGNITTVDKGYPTSLNTWDEVNELIDRRR